MFTLVKPANPVRATKFIEHDTDGADVIYIHRQSGSSHKVYRTPWKGDPRVNIQNAKGMAKAYQVKQVLQAIEQLEVQSGKKY